MKTAEKIKNKASQTFTTNIDGHEYKILRNSSGIYERFYIPFDWRLTNSFDWEKEFTSDYACEKNSDIEITISADKDFIHFRNIDLEGHKDRTLNSVIFTARQNKILRNILLSFF